MLVDAGVMLRRPATDLPRSPTSWAGGDRTLLGPGVCSATQSAAGNNVWGDMESVASRCVLPGRMSSPLPDDSRCFATGARVFFGSGLMVLAVKVMLLSRVRKLPWHLAAKGQKDLECMVRFASDQRANVSTRGEEGCDIRGERGVHPACRHQKRRTSASRFHRK